jgi:hypothetical protein
MEVGNSDEFKINVPKLLSFRDFLEHLFPKGVLYA